MVGRLLNHVYRAICICHLVPELKLADRSHVFSDRIISKHDSFVGSLLDNLYNSTVSVSARKLMTMISGTAILDCRCWIYMKGNNTAILSLWYVGRIQILLIVVNDKNRTVSAITSQISHIDGTLENHMLLVLENIIGHVIACRFKGEVIVKVFQQPPKISDEIFKRMGLWSSHGGHACSNDESLSI